MMMYSIRNLFMHQRVPRWVGLWLVLCCGILITGEPVEAELNFGQAYSEIGTFDGWSFPIGWSASFSDSYLPESETYAWVVYFAPEGIFVALQSSKSNYSVVDVFAGIDAFYGASFSPDKGPVKNEDPSLGVSISMAAFDFTPFPTYGPLSQLGVALQVGQSFSRNKNPPPLLERSIQYSTGLSVAYTLLPSWLQFPLSVSLDYETDMAAGFYPIAEWNLDNAPSETPVDKIIFGLETLSANQGATFVEMMTSSMAQQFLPFMRTLPSSELPGDKLTQARARLSCRGREYLSGDISRSNYLSTIR